IIDLNAEVAQPVVDGIIADGGQAKLHTCNVAEQAEVLDAVNCIGAIDNLVNNAGIAHVGNLEKCAPEDFDRVFSVNVKGGYNALYAAVPAMKANGGGAILNRSEERR